MSRGGYLRQGILGLAQVRLFPEDNGVGKNLGSAMGNLATP